MATTPTCTISATGVARPPLADCLTYFCNGMQGIYGADISVQSDDQDGEWLGFLASALDDTNAMCVAAYNAFSPATAQGAGLSSVVKINGLSRGTPSQSTVSVLLGGTAYAQIVNGVVSDPAGNMWLLPAAVTIPVSGQIVVTATCEASGSIVLGAGVALTIQTQTQSWQTAATYAAAAPGNPVELDPALKARQFVSTMLPSQTGLDGLVGALEEILGVTSAIPFENDSNITDANGIPAKSLAMVIAGGNAAAIASTLLLKKMTGTAMVGTTSAVATDANGVARTMNWYQPTLVPITATVTVKALTGFTSDVEAAIQAALANWVNALPGDTNVSMSRAYTPINAVGNSFELVSLALARNGGVVALADVTIAFFEQAQCQPSWVTIVVAP